MKYRASLHGDRLAWAMGQHEDNGVIGCVVAPPAFPVVVRPCAPDGSEHVPPHDPGADILEAAPCEILVCAARPSVLSHYLDLERAGWKHPRMQVLAADTERVVHA